jgi:hypothetical protein
MQQTKKKVSPEIMFMTMYLVLDTVDKQHPLLVDAPAQPKMEVMKSITPMPINAKINLQAI